MPPNEGGIRGAFAYSVVRGRGAVGLFARSGRRCFRLRTCCRLGQATSGSDTKQTAAPVALLLEDAQIFFEDGKTKTFSERAFRIQTAEGLAAGNISIQWQPATETVTVHKVHIRRGDKVIDVLANGQTFAVLRRETNLDAAMLDGTLTANIQPEGLQQGDIIDVATTIEHSDPF